MPETENKKVKNLPGSLSQALPEAQQTQGIDSGTSVISPARKGMQIHLKRKFKLETGAGCYMH